MGMGNLSNPAGSFVYVPAIDWTCRFFHNFTGDGWRPSLRNWMTQMKKWLARLDPVQPEAPTRFQ